MRLRIELITTLLSILIFLIGYHPAAFGQADLNNGSAERSLSEFLDEAGGFQNPDGYQGRLDISGFEADMDEKGSLIFVKNNGPSPDNQYWTFEENYKNGVSGSVNTVVVSGNYLYIGGSFTWPGGIPAANIARYNLTDGSWDAMGDGPVNYTLQNVHALAISGNNLFVGGRYYQEGGNYILSARYNIEQNSWHMMGDGITTENNNHSVYALEIIGNNLYVGGNFTTQSVGGPAENLARYDMVEEQWHAIPDHFIGEIMDFGSFEDDLFVGEPSGVGIYNTSEQSWGRSISPTLLFFTEAVTGNSEYIYFGGINFDSRPGPTPGTSYSPSIFRYDRQTRVLEPIGDYIEERVQSVHLVGNDLYIGHNNGGLKRYNTVDESMYEFDPGMDGPVHVIKDLEGDLFIGGAFNNAGGSSALGIVSYDIVLNSWHALNESLDNAVDDILVVGDDLYLGGRFKSSKGTQAKYIVRYNMLDKSWYSLGEGVNGEVKALEIVGDNLYVGGLFTQVGEVEAHGIARYHLPTGSWHAVEGGPLYRQDSPTDPTMPGAVYALTRSENDLFVGGDFNGGGEVISWNVIRYDTDTNSWHPMGDGGSTPGFSSTVFDFDLSGNNLFAVGHSLDEGVKRYNISNDSWHSLGGGVNDHIAYAVRVLSDQVYVGGSFTQAGGTAVKGMARFDMTQGTWHTMGEFYLSEFNSPWISAIHTQGNNVYVSGDFTQVDGIAVSNLARYNAEENSWHAMGDGLSHRARKMLMANDHLYVGGEFTMAGNKASSHFARWSGPELEAPGIFQAEIQGPHEGWRMLTSPVADVPVGELLSGIWTQGFAGSDNPDSQNGSNVLFYDEASGAWLNPDEAGGTVPAGSGMIVYVFADDNDNGIADPWPKVLQVQGEGTQGPVTLTLSNTGDESTRNGWHLIGNPFPFPISWDALVSDANGMESMFQASFTWNANANDGGGGYTLMPGFETSSPLLNSATIPPFQSFWVRTSGESGIPGSITIGEQHQAQDEGTLFSSPDPVRHLVLSAEGSDAQELAVLAFRQADELEIERPLQLGQAPIRFGFSGLTEQVLAMRTVDMAAGDVRTLPLSFGARESGSFTLSASGHEWWQDEMEVILTDHAYGTQHVLSEDNDYTFTYEPAEQNRLQKTEASALSATEAIHHPELFNIESENRFELTITMGQTTNTEPAPDLPQEFALKQNYPNPFNPTTKIEYALPEAADVRLDVYNIAGQRVATLIETHQNAGMQSVHFDASRLATGVYLYRLQAGSSVQVRKMTLIK